MAKQIGANFSSELKAANIGGDGWSWGADGAINFGSLPQTTRDQILAVYAAHDPLAPDKSPNIVGFEGALKTVFPISRRKAIAKEYPWFIIALRDRNWTDAQAYLVDAHQTAVITQAEYDAIKVEIAAKNLPISLP